MFKSSGNLYLHTSKEKGLFRSWFRYRKFKTSLEITNKYKHLSMQLHTGNRGSETPIDWNLCLYFISFYGSFAWPGLGLFCEWLGRGHKRKLGWTIHGGKLWWNLWYDDDGGHDRYHKHDLWKQPILPPWRWGRRKYRSWMCLRQGSIDLNPLDAIWGDRYFEYDDVATDAAWLYMTGYKNWRENHDESYPVELTLQKTTRSRRYGPKWVRGFKELDCTVAWSSEKGIPVRNHDWKGDEIYASAVTITKDELPFWRDAALEKLRQQILKDRKHYNYQPPAKE